MKKQALLLGLFAVLALSSLALADHRGRDMERIRIEGTIESIRGQVAYVRDECGERFRVHLGPDWYWDDMGWRIRSGSFVSIWAWMDYDDDYCYADEIRYDGHCYELCDSRGYPRWADQSCCDRSWRPSRIDFDLIFCAPRHHYSHHDYNWSDRHHDRHDWHDGRRGNDCDRDRDRDRGGRRSHRSGVSWHFSWRR